MIVIWFLLGIFFFAYLVIFVYKTKTGSPSVPSSDAHIHAFMRYVKRGMRVADLGCGDGRVLIQAVRHGASSAVGWEIEPLVWLQAKRAIKRQQLQDNVAVYFGDMWGADLSTFDLVFVYQLTRYARRFRDKCRREMRPGSLVVANTYPLPGLKLRAHDGDLWVYML